MNPRPIQHSHSSFAFAALTDAGRERRENEDAIAIRPELGVFLVSDGMGGHQAGALAAKAVVEMMPEIIRRRLADLGNAPPRAIRDWLHKDIMELSQRLWVEAAGRNAIAGMGATLVIALFLRGVAHIAHMGDSRAYLLRRQRLVRLTEDHRLVGLLVSSGEITAQEAERHPARGQLTRYMGMKAEVYPDVCNVRLRQRDRLLLCSDGLTGMVADPEISRILQANANPQQACQALVEAANAAGGRDNITALVADWFGPAA